MNNIVNGWKFTPEWASGFFDVCITKRKRGHIMSYTLYVSVPQKVRAPLDAIKNEFGGYIGIRGKKDPVWAWVVTDAKAELFLRVIYPHTLVKRVVIENAFEFRKTFGSAGKPVPEGAYEIREACKVKGSVLNHPVFG